MQQFQLKGKWNIFRRSLWTGIDYNMIRNSMGFYGITFFSLFFLVFCNSCVDEFWPDLEGKYDNLLVVEGLITNQPGPYTVQLSRSTSINEPSYEPLSGYEITIIDDIGNSEILVENEPGIYQTSSTGIQGIIGRKYSIRIQSTEGKIYQSDFEELQAPVGIDTVYVELENRENSDYPFNIPGYQFYVNTQLAQHDSCYFLWKLERTYQYNADFLIYNWYDGQLHTMTNSDSLQTCWKTDPVHQIFTASTEDLSESVIIGLPLHYVSFDNREFSIRYSLNIRQLTITQKAQEYWNEVKELNSSNEGLYTKVPFQISGNVICTSHGDEKVLGYFLAAGVDERRIFFNRPSPPVEMYYSVCILTGPDYEAYGWMFRNKDPREWPLYVTMDAQGTHALPVQECVNCLLNGGSIVKPDFWEE